MRSSKDTPILLFVSRWLSPYIMLFGLYVIFHGHYSPGGGFQGGALLAAGVIIIRLAGGDNISKVHFHPAYALKTGITGIIIVFAVAIAAIAGGGEFLNYGSIDVAGEETMLRYYGILVFEVGVGLAVMGVLIFLFDTLLDGFQWENKPEQTSEDNQKKEVSDG